MHFSNKLFYVGLRRYIAPLFGMYVLVRYFVILQGGAQFFSGAFLNFNISSESSLPGANPTYNSISI
jgi:hypothetical protein